MIRFIDRDKELELLNEEWNSPGAKFIVLYGRRRIGKTSLLNEFCKGKKGIFHISADEYNHVQISEIRQKFSSFFNDDFLRNTDLPDWENLFLYLTRIIPPEKRFYVVLDEFTYLVKNDRSILSKLQRFWDTFLSRTNIFLVICGSDLGMMENEVLSYSSPTYGRRSRDILLPPMELKSAMKFTNMNFDDRLRLFMTVGGIPEYLTRAEKYGDYNKFIQAEFWNSQGYFYREPYYLLSQEFKDYNTYFSILNAISYGKNKPSEIANFLGVEGRKIYPYLENLIRLRFISRITPVFSSKNSGHYEISDRMVEFWFNYVYTNREFIERGTVNENFNFQGYFGRVFERTIKDSVFPSIYKDCTIGTWWYKDTEIEVIGISPDKKRIIFGECKWRDNVNPAPIVEDLRKKVKVFLRNMEFESVSYRIIAKSFSRKIEDDNISLLDLSDLEGMLANY